MLFYNIRSSFQSLLVVVGCVSNSECEEHKPYIVGRLLVVVDMLSLVLNVENLLY